MSQSFTIKTLQIEVTLATGSFSEGGNTRIIEGLACNATITKPGLPEKNSASVSIWGLEYDAMAQMTMLAFKPLQYRRNILTVRAGEVGGTLAVAFRGNIVSAFADFNESPDVSMKFEADTGSYAQQIAKPPQTIRGEAKAEAIFQNLANESGYAYQNEGLSASVSNAWLSGSPLDKAIKLSNDIGCELYVDDDTIVTMPAGQARSGNAVLLNKDTGLIGYPTFNQDGISCRCIYNPDLRYGGLIRVESIVPRATGTWRIRKLTHELSAYNPGGGPWESQIEAMYYG